MKRFLKIKIISDDRGSLGVIEKLIPYKIKRIFYLFNLKKIRGEHYHKKNRLALLCLNGECDIQKKKKNYKKTYKLENQKKILFIHPYEWHSIHFKKKNTIIIAFASQYYDKRDYYKISVK